MRYGVNYHEYQQQVHEDVGGGGIFLMPSVGKFEQEVEIQDEEHERIEVPNIGDTRQATVLHDFNQVRDVVSHLTYFCCWLGLSNQN
jgi:hypothetical protein